MCDEQVGKSEVGEEVGCGATPPLKICGEIPFVDACLDVFLQPQVVDNCLQTNKKDKQKLFF